MALAPDVRDREALWDRIESSMDEDEIAEYLDDMEASGRSVGDRPDWEGELAVLRDAWASGASLTYPASSIYRVGDRPRSVYVGEGVGDALAAIARHKVDELRKWSAHPKSDEDDALLGAFVSALDRVDDAVRGREIAELEPVQVLGLTLGVRHLFPPGASAGGDEAARHIAAVLFDLVEEDVGRSDRHIRGFIEANRRHFGGH